LRQQKVNGNELASEAIGFFFLAIYWSKLLLFLLKAEMTPLRWLFFGQFNKPRCPILSKRKSL